MNAIMQLVAVIVTAIALASPAHAIDCKVIDSNADWKTIECLNLETDNTFRITQSSDGVIRKAEFPYADGPYRLQYECGHLVVYAPDGVNLRADGGGKLKFDKDVVKRKHMWERESSSAFIRFTMEEKDWYDAIKSYRLRVWMPYYRGDVVVDFSLKGLIASHKTLQCEHSLEFYAGMNMSVHGCRALAYNELSSMQRGAKANARIQRETIVQKCSWHGEKAVAEFYSHAKDTLAQFQRSKRK